MDVCKKNLTSKVTPVKISLAVAIFLLLALVTLWQQIRMFRKDEAITVLQKENSLLKENLLTIDEQLVQLKDAASDVRLFQREVIKVIKDIDDKYPVSFATANKPASVTTAHASFNFNTDEALKRANENIFKLASFQTSQRFETANLLGQAVSIRDIIAKTPSMMPANGQINSEFGMRADPFTHQRKMHQGIDIAAPIGTPVFASADGRITVAHRNPSYGNVIEISHADNYSTTYAHLSEILVSKNQFVKRGQEIGRVGNTGTRCQGAHVHFEISKNKTRLNPRPYLISSAPNYL